MPALLSRFRRSTRAEASKSLRSRAFKASQWVLLAHFGALSLRILGTVILTRIFNPELFGVLAIITSVQVVIALLTDVGLRQAVIQSANGDRPEFLKTAFTFQIIRGFFNWLLCLLLSFGLSIGLSHQLFPPQSVYAEPDLPFYLGVAALSSVIIGFQSMKMITNARNLEVQRVSAIEFFVQLASLGFIIVAGWLTRSIWSYVAGLLFSSALTVILSHLFLRGRSDGFAWDQASAKELVRFGRWTFLSSVMSAFAINGDKLLLGGWLSAQNLGFYSIAYNIVTVPDGLASRLFGSVAFPALSEAARSDPGRLSRMFVRIRWVSDSALLFIAGGLFATGPTIIALLYEPRYASAGWMIQYLSFMLVFARYGVAQSAYLALGRPEYASILSFAKLISLFGATTLGFHIAGVQGAVLSVACHLSLSAICTLYINRKHGLNSWLLEFGVLVCWLCGWLLGLGFSELVALWK